MKPLHLTAESLNWSFDHFRRHGDTDVFPVPFEYELLQQVRPEIITYLESIDFSTHSTGAAIKVMAPKHVGGYRAACQLDIADSLLFSAIITDEAAVIEKARIPVSEKVACAYRIAKDPSGDLFSKDFGWKDFHARSAELAMSGNYDFVLLADISDFYNQISTHRLENALSHAGISHEKSKAIERFLVSINGHHHSRGIPVGPTASIILAEACLSDVDSCLKRLGATYTRYVDDFRIFTSTHEEANYILYELARYLYMAHRLSFQANKTEIRGLGEFVEADLEDPEELEERRRTAWIDNLLEERWNPYDDEAPEWDDKDEQESIFAAISELFDAVRQRSPFPLGLARYVLKRSAALRLRNGYEQVLTNIDRFLPIMRDVAFYIQRVHTARFDEHLGETIESVLCRGEFARVPLVRLWCYSIALRQPSAFNGEALLQLAESDTDETIRQRVPPLIAKSYDIIDWIRQRKETWQNQSSWGQRAMIYSAGALPKDERSHWLSSLEGVHDPLIRLVAKATRMKHS